MNFKDTLISAELVLETGEVPLIIGESGIGKTALAKKLANKNNFKLVVIDGNLLKEGEIGGLPTIESYKSIDSNGNFQEKKATIYAVHTKLKEIDEEILNGNKVLLFIDEINRCEHTVQQELMNLILNREINGYKLHNDVKILAAMNPSNKYGEDFDYQVVDMDAAQENRFVWLNMENDYIDWISWAKEMRGQGIKLYILSNTNNKEKVEKVAQTLEIPYKHFAMKPLKRGFKYIQKETKINPENIAVVGDQIFTDVLGGNRSNMFTILVDPIDSQKDYWYTAWKRPIENKIKNNYKAKEEKNKNVY